MAADTYQNDIDVTGKVQVSSPDAVLEAILDILNTLFPDEGSFPIIEEAMDTFHKMFAGKLPGFVGCETVYHDMQHSLDVTLAMARLLGGHEKEAKKSARLGLDLVQVGIIMALFHDAGYIRRSDRNEVGHGAEYILEHVARSGEILKEFLPKWGFADFVDMAEVLVHYTAPMQNIKELGVKDFKHHRLGQLLGTADYMAQMSDRCYLEKVTNRLHAEFVLGGVGMTRDEQGNANVEYETGEDLLRGTPAFFEGVTQKRLNGDFDKAYTYFQHWFDGENPYIEAINKNIAFLKSYLKDNKLPDLKRNPECFTADKDALSDTQTMAAERIRKFLDKKAAENK